MAIQIGAKPDSGFNDPIGMLKDCHRRIEKFLGILRLVPGRAHGRALNPEERSAVESALAYFRSGGQRHTADEEQSLFPRLRQSGDAALAELDRLEDDHREADHLHASIEALYSAWIAAGSLDPAQAGQLARETARLQQLYAAHIRVEETIVFARASQLLEPSALAAIGAEFQRRRNSGDASELSGPQPAGKAANP